MESGKVESKEKLLFKAKGSLSCWSRIPYLFLIVLFSQFLGFFLGVAFEVIIHFEQYKPISIKEIFFFCFIFGPIVATTLTGFLAEKMRGTDFNKRRLLAFWSLDVVVGYISGLLMTYFIVSRPRFASYGDLIEKSFLVFLLIFFLYISVDLPLNLIREKAIKENIIYLFALCGASFAYLPYFLGWMEGKKVGTLDFKEAAGIVLPFLSAFFIVFLWIFLSRFARTVKEKNGT